MASEALRLVEIGFKAIKIKAGSDVEDEMKGVENVRDAVGDDIELRVDPERGLVAGIDPQGYEGLY